MLDATSFPVSSQGKTSILFKDRFDNHILQILRILGPFAVLFVVQDESVYFLPKSLSHVHHAVFLILVFNEIKTLIQWSLITFLIQREYPFFLVTSSFLCCCNVGVVFRCKFLILNNLLLGPPKNNKDLRYLPSLCHLSKMVL